MIYIITGEIHQGKTTFVRELIQIINESLQVVEGIISLSHYENNEPVSYSLLDVKTANEYFLCSTTKRINCQQFGKFYFDNQTFNIGNSILKNSSEESILIIDEVGKLELVKESGWFPAIKFLVENNFPKQIWVVRKDFIPILLEKYPVKKENIFDIKKLTAREIMRLIQ